MNNYEIPRVEPRVLAAIRRLYERDATRRAQFYAIAYYFYDWLEIIYKNPPILYRDFCVRAYEVVRTEFPAEFPSLPQHVIWMDTAWIHAPLVMVKAGAIKMLFDADYPADRLWSALWLAPAQMSIEEASRRAGKKFVDLTPYAYRLTTINVPPAQLMNDLLLVGKLKARQSAAQ